MERNSARRSRDVVRHAGAKNTRIAISPVGVFCASSRSATTRTLADAPPARSRLLSVTFLGEARKVTPTAGATAPVGATCVQYWQEKSKTSRYYRN
jgi:hypothetical protein